MNRTAWCADAPEPHPHPGAAVAALIRYFRERHRGPGPAADPYRLTALGAWAASRAPHVFSFFQRIGLHQYELFIDLGSGDGVVTCLAGLFTRAVGIEVDSELCGLARKAAQDLKLSGRVDFICGDYRQLPIQRADCLYHYPDKPIRELENLLANWAGDLLVYGPHYPLQTMTPMLKLACGRERMVLYRNA